MKFSIHLSTRIHDKRDELALINYMTDLALWADAEGFGGISLTEHHIHENQGYQNSLLFACALAPRLKQAAIVLATVNPAIHHPVRLVESCNLIDQLNGGRLVVGFGSGFKDTDLVAFGRDLAQRHELFEQGLKAALEVWAYQGGAGPLEVTVGTDRARIEGPVNPSSLRKPHPILARGTLNEAGRLEAARLGWAMFTTAKSIDHAREQISPYHAALNASGHPPEQIALAKEWSAVAKAIHISDTDEQARAEALEFFGRNPSGAIARNPDDMICGSPETVARFLRGLSDAGVGQMICGFLIDLTNKAPLQKCLRLFRDEVMPAVRA